jgi:hypothetical protein
LSFFDEDDEPTRKRPRPRRATTPPPVAGADPSTLRTRQAVAIVGTLVFLFLLVLVFRGCADSRKKNALKDYNREHTSIVSESDQQVGDPFFEALSNPSTDPGALGGQISSLRVAAEGHLQQAERLSVPSEMVPAHRSLLITLEFRRDAIAFIQDQVPDALADDEETAQAAVKAIAGEMQAFLTSDVIHEGRVVPMIQKALDDAEVGGQRIQQSRVLDSLAWLDEGTVGERLNPDNAGASKPRKGEIAPGLHGNGITAVSVGDTTLQPGEVVNRIPSDRGLTFIAAFQNQGENDEFDVEVSVKIAPDEGGKAITAKKTIDTIVKGAKGEASLAITKPPAAGVAATVTVEVKPVPGEKKTDNNKQTYRVLFT